MDDTATTIPDQHPASASGPAPASATMPLPRVTIRFCIQCRWMLRAAYFAQELLSTFSTSLGEVAIQPTTGGVFIVAMDYADPGAEVTASGEPASSTGPEPGPSPTIQHHVLWDRKIDGGFPETKELKRRVRDLIEPGRNLGHVDRDYPRPRQHPEKGTMPAVEQQQQQQQPRQPPGPRWPQRGESKSVAQDGQTTADPPAEPPKDVNTQAGPQRRTLKDLGPYPRQRTTDTAGGPVYDPRMPGGGNMPVVPPVAPRSGSVFQDTSAREDRPQPQEARPECEDCQ